MSQDNQESTRRDILKCTAVAAAAAITTGGCASLGGKNVQRFDSSHFYDSKGAFFPTAAKDAYLAMMEAHGYPISDVLKTDELWVCDFLQRDFSKLGMGGIFWINASGQYSQSGDKAYKGDFKDASYGYLGHEIFLLPGQMLPEHRHIGGAEGYGPKMESWHVRYGTVDFFGEYKGAGDETLISNMPKSEQPWGYGQDWFKSKYVARRTAKSGKLYTLEDPESWHGQIAGPQGAIVSEYATYHNQVEFSKPDMEFASSEAS